MGNDQLLQAMLRDDMDMAERITRLESRVGELEAQVTLQHRHIVALYDHANTALDHINTLYGGGTIVARIIDELTKRVG